jgi:hypothetical protein
VIAYASRTGTKRNLEALRRAGWRLLVSATGAWRTEGFQYAIDNGAWTAYQKGQPFDADAFLGIVESLGEGADWVALPDIVAGGARSLDLSLQWKEKLGATLNLLLPVQDGMKAADVIPVLGPRCGIFVGGTTEWKLATLAHWAWIAKQHDAWCHAGRVNTRGRIALCARAGVDSFDGTSATRYSTELPKLQAERSQQLIFRD